MIFEVISSNKSLGGCSQFFYFAIVNKKIKIVTILLIAKKLFLYSFK